MYMYAAYIQMHFRLDVFQGSNQYEPWSDWSKKSSLMWVYIVYNIGHLKT